MSETSIIIPAAPQFSFKRTVLSHGWYMLPPFSWDAASATLLYVYQSAAGAVLRLRMRAFAEGVAVDSLDCELENDRLRLEVSRAVKRMLNIDWDLSAFYAGMAAHEGYHWLESERRGRILTAPSLWEDLAKVLLTTNCRWAQTVNMCRQLCRLGAPHPVVENCRAFPTAERIAAMNFDDFAEQTRAGYRSAYLHELARKIGDGAVDLAAWLALDGDEFFRAVKSLKGFGDYAAGTLARMVGHFDKIAIDTACHAMFAELHNGGVKGSASDIKTHYERFGRWRGLVMWMDIMRHYEA
ncbi:MAG: 3-methyladenine DNA glycosylase [Chloroflexota bacterium]|nr:3-methyladenine DNA glycosylase [Chloroflexota bacterium]MDE2909899.1 3-methyladenine DNA glycosylase [Chloroflexota bacterium]